MSEYEIAYAQRESSEPFSNYLFEVSKAGRKVAELSHDYRGEEHWMRLPGGPWIAFPEGILDPERIIKGGGPQKLTLSSAGVRALDQLLG